MLKKIVIYSIMYFAITFLLSNDWDCILNPDGYCLLNVGAKYVFFLVVMVIYDKYIRRKIFKNEK